MNQRQSLRQSLRQQRQQLSPEQRQQAAQHICQQLLHHNDWQNSQRIACYLANDGEVDTTAIIQQIWQANKSCYLPVIAPQRQLHFALYQANTPLINNRYGIAEPDPAHATFCPAEELDLVLVPLVGFDAAGTRLGMGSGYYDRTFAFLQQLTQATKPVLIGLAYQCQQVENLIAEPWDVKLQAVITA